MARYSFYCLNPLRGQLVYNNGWIDPNLNILKVVLLHEVHGKLILLVLHQVHGNFILLLLQQVHGNITLDMQIVVLLDILLDEGPSAPGRALPIPPVESMSPFDCLIAF